ncbi:hypothetical protein D3C84_906440 [compost metagenome]
MCEQSRFNFVDHVAAMPTIRICAIAYRDRFHILQRFCDSLRWERTDQVRSNRTRFNALLAELVDDILDDFGSRIHQEYRDFRVLHPI